MKDIELSGDLNWDNIFEDIGLKPTPKEAEKIAKPKPNWNEIFKNADSKNIHYEFDKNLLYIAGKKIVDIQADNDLVEYSILNAAYVYNDLFLSKIPNHLKWGLITAVPPFKTTYRRNWAKTKQDKKDKKIATLRELFPTLGTEDLAVLHSFVTTKDINKHIKDRGDKC